MWTWRWCVKRLPGGRMHVTPCLWWLERGWLGGRIWLCLLSCGMQRGACPLTCGLGVSRGSLGATLWSVYLAFAGVPHGPCGRFIEAVRMAVPGCLPGGRFVVLCRQSCICLRSLSLRARMDLQVVACNNHITSHLLLLPGRMNRYVLFPGTFP